MSQESDIQWNIDRVWAAVDGLRSRLDMWSPWSQSVDGRLNSAECGRAKHGKRLSDVEQRIEALEKANRGDFMGWLRSARTATQVDMELNERMAAKDGTFAAEISKTLDQIAAMESPRLVIKDHPPVRREFDKLHYTPPTCGTCRWYSGGGKNPTYQGICKRFPPLAQPFDSVRAEYGRALCPSVNKDDACGEHSPR